MKVIKRDGREVEFDKQKIINAVLKAFKEIDRNITVEATIEATEIADFISKTCCAELYVRIFKILLKKN